MTSEELLALDRAHVWHPYGSLPPGAPPLLVESASGVGLRLADGRELIDGMASWWCAIHGYRHPALDAAARGQLERMAHVMFGGLTHEPGIALARRLVELAPDGLEHVFFADAGSVSVEVAVKMALQFQRSRGRPEKQRLLALRGGYHGDTFGAMSVCDPVGGMHHLFAGTLTQQLFARDHPAGLANEHSQHVELLGGQGQLLVVQDLDTTITQLQHRRAALPERSGLTGLEVELAGYAAEKVALMGRRAELMATQKDLEGQIAVVAERRTGIEQRMYAARGSSTRDLQAMDEEVRHLTQRGIGVLITDHNVRETLGICDHAYIINQGTNGLELLSILITNNSISEASLVGRGSAIAVILLVISLVPITLYLTRVMRSTGE